MHGWMRRFRKPRNHLARESTRSLRWLSREREALGHDSQCATQEELARGIPTIRLPALTTRNLRTITMETEKIERIEEECRQKYKDKTND